MTTALPHRKRSGLDEVQLMPREVCVFRIRAHDKLPSLGELLATAVAPCPPDRY